MSIPFTQFKMPHGHEVCVTIDRSRAIEGKALTLMEAGYRFEIEMLMTGDVNMECIRGEDCIAGELCTNGPAVPEAVDRMIERAYLVLTARRMP